MTSAEFYLYMADHNLVTKTQTDRPRYVRRLWQSILCVHAMRPNTICMRPVTQHWWSSAKC